MPDYELTTAAANETESLVTVTNVVEHQISLGALLAEYNQIIANLAQMEADYNARIAAETARKNELNNILSNIKTTNNLTFELAP